MHTFLGLLKFSNFIAFIVFGFILTFITLTDIEAVYSWFTWYILVWQFLAQIILTVAQEILPDDENIVYSISKHLKRGDNNTQMSLFGFKWNSIFSH